MRSLSVSLLAIAAALLAGPSAMAEPSAMDARDQKILDALSAGEIEALDADLRQALILYYNGAYDHSLPLLKKIAERAGTLDVLYWYASSAYRLGRLDVAVPQFRAMLKRRPGLHAVRLELALALLAQGKKQAADAEAALVLAAADAPQGVKNSATAIRQRISGKAPTARAGAAPAKRTLVSLSLTGGVQHDDNINAQSDNQSTGSLSSAGPDRSLGHTLSGTATLLHDFGAAGGFVWRNQLSGYLLDHWDHGANDYGQVDVSTALEHLDQKMVARLPVGHINRRYAHAELSDAWYVAPSLIFPKLLADGLFTASYRYEDESFAKTADRIQDNHSHTLTLSPSWFLGDPQQKRRDMVSLSGGWTIHDAATDQYTYDEWSLSPAWVGALGVWDVSAMLQGTYAYRNYDGNVPAVGFTPPAEREDRRYAVTALLSRTFQDRYTVSASYAHTRNDSNTALYDYGKNVVALNFGVNLDF